MDSCNSIPLPIQLQKSSTTATYPPPPPPPAPTQHQPLSTSSTNVAALASKKEARIAPIRLRIKPPRRAMENFKAFVMKLAASDPTQPLTVARKDVIERRLRVSFPNFNTPDHPTYAAMIHRAIVELKEQKGTTEESISEFIRNEYDDLPYAHVTLLKHHLLKLCVSAEIGVTSKKCYYLPDGIANCSSDPCSSPKRESMQQSAKRQGDKLRGRASQHRKGRTKEQNQSEVEQMEVIQGQKQVQEQQSTVHEEQNLSEEPYNELIEKLNLPQSLEQEKQRVLIQEQNQVEGRILDSEHLEKNQSEVPSSERPPGFNAMSIEEMPSSEPNHAEVQSLDWLPGFNSVEVKKFSSSEVQHQELAIADEIPPELQQTPEEEATQTTERQEKHRGRRKPIKSQPKTTTYSSYKPLVPQQSTGEQPQDLPTPERACKLRKLQHQQTHKNPQHRQLRHRAPKPDQSTATTHVELLPHQQQHEEHLQLLTSGTLREIKETLAEESTQSIEQQPKRCGPLIEEKDELEQQIMDSGHLDQNPHEVPVPQEKLPSSEVHQEPELPNEESPSELKQTPVEESTETTEEQAQLHGWRKQMGSQPNMIEGCNNMDVVPRRSKRKQLPELPTPERACKLQHQQLENPQLRKLRPRPPKPEQFLTTSMVVPLNQKQQHEEHPQLPNSGTLQELEQTPAEESIEGEQRQPKLGGRQKLLKSNLKIRAGSLGSCLDLQPDPKQLSVKPSPERAEEHQDKQAEENSQHQQLCPRNPQYGEAETITITKLVFLQHQHENQQKLFQDQGRALEHNIDMTSTGVEASALNHENQHEQQHPTLRARGKHAKPKNVLPAQKKLQERKRRGRPPKLKPDNTKKGNVLPSEKKLQKPQRRGRRLPKLKPNNTKNGNVLPSEKKLQEPKLRGRPPKMPRGLGRLRKMDGRK